MKKQFSDVRFLFSAMTIVGVIAVLNMNLKPGAADESTPTVAAATSHSVAQMALQSEVALAAPVSPSTMKMGDPLPANAFVELAKLMNPTVVNISTSTMPKFRQGFGGGGRGRDPLFDMLEQLYGRQMIPQNIKPQQALGTGFIIREDGLIVTNNHVIEGADEIKVQLSENSKKLYDAKVIGTDQRTDLALIKITPDEKLPVAALGSSKDLEVGEWVAAFGNPFGNGHTMTKGIVSAKGRDINELNRFPLIQTDAPINPGNSGGPLVNLKGQVIGVNSAIDARAQGIGFAIPIDEVKTIIPQLEKNGRIKKGYLGVALADLDPQTASYLGLKEAEGALIADVEKNGPAYKAGVKPYDVVVEFGGKKISDSGDLQNTVADYEIGKKADFKVMREGKEKALTLVVAERIENTRAKGPQQLKKFFGQTTAPFELGFSVSDMNEQLRKEFEIDRALGLMPVIVEVERGTQSHRAGLKPGDVVLEVNRKDVKTAQDVIRNIKKGTNSFRIARDGSASIFMMEAR